ncbi:hypothetical protein ZIOFF_034814 [Zingiber officinale]|uniref:Uncharacterized protein n=1 Tax=Zingiber officinale TaxID=94328 RepID=A0A8J5G7X9_ZINOF|nr:hypothetical protein ZIOFF_034814 [Zingiber officinale]
MEKQKLHLQLGKMEVVLRKIQDPALKLISQDQEMLLPALGSQETRDMINTDKHITCGSPGTASKDIPMIDNPYKASVELISSLIQFSSSFNHFITLLPRQNLGWYFATGYGCCFRSSSCRHELDY